MHVVFRADCMSLHICLTSYNISEFGQFPNFSEEEFDDIIMQGK